MEISAKGGYEIHLDRKELWGIACDIRYALITTLKNYWVHHQNSWEEGDKNRLNQLKHLFSVLNRVDMYDSIFIEAKEIFEAHNSKKQADI